MLELTVYDVLTGTLGLTMVLTAIVIAIIIPIWTFKIWQSFTKALRQHKASSYLDKINSNSNVRMSVWKWMNKHVPKKDFTEQTMQELFNAVIDAKNTEKNE